ncbi:MAG: hypothetical protein GXO77_06805 [Calditrichaeota bacterium]|nr:hypothetical protein [Calditrichota bacterium]
MKRILILLITSLSLYAQGFDGVGMSLADNYSALTRGIHALGYNPANIGIPRGNTLELNIVGMNLATFNNSFSYNTYQKFFVTNGNENYWSDKDKKAFLDLIPDGGLKINTEMNANVLGFAFNNFAMAFQTVAFGEVNSEPIKDLFGKALYGDSYTLDYELNYPSFLHGSSFGGVKLSLAYAYPIRVRKYLPDFSFISVGIGINYFMPMGVVQVEKSSLSVKRTQFDDFERNETTLVTQIRSAHAEGSTPAGKGKSYNFGVSALFRERWFFSLSFMDVGGSINYSTNAERMTIEEYNSVDIYHSSKISNESSERSIDTTETLSGFDTGVPSFMRVGVAYTFKKNLIFTSEWKQGLNKNFGNSTTPRIGFGVHYKPLWWLPLRSGVSIGGSTGFLLGMGFGIDMKYWALDLSYAMKNALWPTRSEGVFMGMNMMVKF